MCGWAIYGIFVLMVVAGLLADAKKRNGAGW